MSDCTKAYDRFEQFQALSGAGIILGAAATHLSDERVPHRHFAKGLEGPQAASVRKIWLFVMAITLHNGPEGLAVGVGFGGGDTGAATTLALGIGRQNAPETHRHGHQKGATTGLVVGVVVMMFLDVALG